MIKDILKKITDILKKVSAKVEHLEDDNYVALKYFSFMLSYLLGLPIIILIDLELALLIEITALPIFGAPYLFIIFIGYNISFYLLNYQDEAKKLVSESPIKDLFITNVQFYLHLPEFVLVHIPIITATKMGDLLFNKVFTRFSPYWNNIKTTVLSGVMKVYDQRSHVYYTYSKFIDHNTFDIITKGGLLRTIQDIKAKIRTQEGKGPEFSIIQSVFGKKVLSPVTMGNDEKMMEHIKKNLNLRDAEKLPAVLSVMSYLGKVDGKVFDRILLNNLVAYHYTKNNTNDQQTLLQAQKEILQTIYGSYLCSLLNKHEHFIDITSEYDVYTIDVDIYFNYCNKQMSEISHEVSMALSSAMNSAWEIDLYFINASVGKLRKHPDFNCPILLKNLNKPEHESEPIEDSFIITETDSKDNSTKKAKLIDNPDKFDEFITNLTFNLKDNKLKDDPYCAHLQKYFDAGKFFQNPIQHGISKQMDELGDTKLFTKPVKDEHGNLLKKQPLPNDIIYGEIAQYLTLVKKKDPKDLSSKNKENHKEYTSK